MTKKYAVEAILRPPIEFFTCSVAFVSAATIYSQPSIFLVPNTIGSIVSIGLCVIGVYRLRQGVSVVRYRSVIKRTPSYTLSRSRIPVSTTHLFLGRGFKWVSKHTQRIHDARDPDVEKIIKPGKIRTSLRQLEVEYGDVAVLKPIFAITSKDSILNPLRPLPKTGGDPIIHGVGSIDERSVYLSLMERSGHLLVKGTTGVGKTRLAEMLITQDIRRKNNCVIVIDPKGDADLLLTTYLESKKNGRKCYVFHLGFPEYSARYNAIGSFSRITEISSRISNPLPSDGDSAAFREFVWQFVNVISVALISLGEKVTYESIKMYMRQIDPLLVRYGKFWLDKRIENWEKTFSDKKKNNTQKSINSSNFKSRQQDAVAMYYTLLEYKVEDSVIAGLLHSFQYDKTYFDKITNAVGPFLEKLTSGKVSQILSPSYTDGDNRPIIDWEEVLRQEAVVYVGLDALTDQEVASAVGSTMFSDLTSLAGRKTKFGMNRGLPKIGKERDPAVVIHGDEFNDLIGPHMITLLNKSRSAGYQLNLYTQTWSDVEAKLGSVARAGQIAGNLNTTIMMRVKEPRTAEMMTSQLPETDVNKIMAVSGVDDSGAGDAIGFKSRNEDRISTERVPLITTSDITSLPIGHAFVLMSGSHLYKIRIPLMASVNNRDDNIEHNIREMVTEMREQYMSGHDWFVHDIQR